MKYLIELLIIISYMTQLEKRVEKENYIITTKAIETKIDSNKNDDVLHFSYFHKFQFDHFYTLFESLSIIKKSFDMETKRQIPQITRVNPVRP